VIFLRLTLQNARQPPVAKDCLPGALNRPVGLWGSDITSNHYNLSFVIRKEKIEPASSFALVCGRMVQQNLSSFRPPSLPQAVVERIHDIYVTQVARLCQLFRSSAQHRWILVELFRQIFEDRLRRIATDNDTVRTPREALISRMWQSYSDLN
jgi:hypothetical protein